jgi:hypothetical protein
MKILYVEDNEDNVYMLKNRLSRFRFCHRIPPNVLELRKRGFHRLGPPADKSRLPVSRMAIGEKCRHSVTLQYRTSRPVRAEVASRN